MLGRVVLGKTTPLVYEVSLNGELVRGRIPVVGLDQPIQHLNLPPKISGVLQDPDVPPRTLPLKKPTYGAHRSAGRGRLHRRCRGSRPAAAVLPSRVPMWQAGRWPITSAPITQPR
ncbi:hypothetical protein [Deinococcus malanensis]|uniref:hypothetical protein n=1 Tax=Deinococcus malanensis TaxID=1706855 RepID=UPI003A8DDABE